LLRRGFFSFQLLLPLLIIVTTRYRRRRTAIILFLLCQFTNLSLGSNTLHRGPNLSIVFRNDLMNLFLLFIARNFWRQLGQLLCPAIRMRLRPNMCMPARITKQFFIKEGFLGCTGPLTCTTRCDAAIQLPSLEFAVLEFYTVVVE
jgi:hypothetical protein